MKGIVQTQETTSSSNKTKDEPSLVIYNLSNRGINDDNIEDELNGFESTSSKIDYYEIDLSHNNIGDEGIRILVERLIGDNIIKVLDLSYNNKIKDQGIRDLAYLLSVTTSIVSFRFKHEYFNVSIDAMKEKHKYERILIKAISTNPTILSIDLGKALHLSSIVPFTAIAKEMIASREIRSQAEAIEAKHKKLYVGRIKELAEIERLDTKEEKNTDINKDKNKSTSTSTSINTSINTTLGVKYLACFIERIESQIIWSDKEKQNTTILKRLQEHRINHPLLIHGIAKETHRFKLPSEIVVTIFEYIKPGDIKYSIRLQKQKGLEEGSKEEKSESIVTKLAKRGANISNIGQSW